MGIKFSRDKLILEGVEHAFPQGYTLAVKKREWSYPFTSINNVIHKYYLDTTYRYQFSYKLLNQAMLQYLEELYLQFYAIKGRKLLLIQLGTKVQKCFVQNFTELNYQIQYRDTSHCMYSDISFSLE